MIYLLIFIQQLIASGTHIVGKGLSNNVDPALVLLFRSITASLVYLIWLGIRKQLVFNFTKKEYLMILLLGFLNIPLNQFLFLQGLKYTTAPNASLAYALMPSFVLLIEIFFMNYKPSKSKVIGIVIALIGAIIVLFDKGAEMSSTKIIGDLMMLGASISWSVYTIIGKRFSEERGAILGTGLSMFSGLILYIPLFLFIPIHTNVMQIQFTSWMQIAYLGVLTSGVGYAIWYYALTKIEASKVSVFNNLQPVLTTILSFLIFGISTTTEFYIGGAFIIIGVWFTQRK